MKKMNIAVLSRNPRGYTIRRLREEAKARGHNIRIMDTLNFSIYVEQSEPDLKYNNRVVPIPDVVIPRIGASITHYGTAVVRQFEQMGVPALNTSHAIASSRDKLRSMQIFSRHDIGIPATAFVRRQQDVLPAIEQVGGVPVIIKLLEGSQGTGVILAESTKVAEAIIETLQSAKQNVLLQKFVAESRGRDVRAFVVGGHVVAAMRRVAAGQEYRSNVHKGGRTEAIELSPEYEATAVKAAQIMGLRVAGVDMLESEDGPQVMEVNSSPGLEGIEKVSGVNIAAKIIEHAESLLQFPEIDLRQRMTLKRGYGAAEFQITPDSPLANKTIAETELRDREVLVVNIDRNGLIIPAPHGSEKLMVGDWILCFGKLITLQSMVPVKKKRRRKKKKKKKVEEKVVSLS